MKRKIDSIKLSKKGDLGVMSISTKDNNFLLSKAVHALNANTTILIKTKSGQQGQISCKELEEIKLNKLEKNIIIMDKNDTIINISPVINELSLR